MSNAVIIYASTHHGNTKKVVEAIAKEFDAELVDATQVHEKDLSGYYLIGFASGIYAAQFHQQIKNFAHVNLPQNKKIFFIMTSAMNKDFTKSMAESIKGKNAEVVGKFTCHGYNTFGPFKLVGGTSKGHPDENDLKDAVEFYRTLVRVGKA
ncbi:flavodoxin family protein [Butyrivibrio sp. INlla14]|uniref:flavodoxin family protein n=1 Tax=Butyrivibrio sp. INlla14 TaxID=1520808 RepID=UPI0008771D94|nr:flavodoxin family protein [Butyrivibrio sp. INlla14]SCY14366.1 Flavodoxin [Butyrivibrio sp. INlla14]